MVSIVFLNRELLWLRQKFWAMVGIAIDWSVLFLLRCFIYFLYLQTTGKQVDLISGQLVREWEPNQLSKVIWLQISWYHRYFPTSPGPVVIGGDSCSRGCGFESQHRTLDGHFHIDLMQKIVLFVSLKRPKKQKKRPGMTHLKTTFIQNTVGLQGRNVANGVTGFEIVRSLMNPRLRCSFLR